MELSLENVRTGETFALDPFRALVGTAEHADVRAASGPYLAAVAIRYPSTGWALFGLSDDEDVTLNRRPLGPGTRVAPKEGDALAVGDERYIFHTDGDAPSVAVAVPPPACLAFVRSPDGAEECRAVDHDLLFGRLPFCHVQLADTRLSRVHALLATDGGHWFLHNLGHKLIGVNKKGVPRVARLGDGDELLIGPLVVRVELPAGEVEAPTVSTRSAATRPDLDTGPLAHGTDVGEQTDDGSGENPTVPNLSALRASAQRLDGWLKRHEPAPLPAKAGLSGWLESTRDRLRRFWLDTPETTSARGLRNQGKWNEAFEVLDRAIRARPDSPDLLRELYRLYEAANLGELCYRPLRAIEKIAEMRGTPDPWVYETLARVCEAIGVQRPGMFDRAVAYLNKLEAATGVSKVRERADVMARRAMRDNGIPTTRRDDD
jgi:hypothetical protein